LADCRLTLQFNAISCVSGQWQQQPFSPSVAIVGLISTCALPDDCDQHICTQGHRLASDSGYSTTPIVSSDSQFHLSTDAPDASWLSCISFMLISSENWNKTANYILRLTKANEVTDIFCKVTSVCKVTSDNALVDICV